MRKSFYNDLASRMAFLEKIHAHFDKDVISLKELNSYCENKKNDVDNFPYFILRERKVGRGQFSIVPKHVGFVTPAPKQVAAEPVAAAAFAAQVIPIASKRAQNVTESFVPDRNETYVPFGFYNDMRDIIKSRIFYPIYITGLSGNGKTMMIEQVCAALKRELIRVNITKRTDESDLIGSYELVDGNTIRREGPVITAMRRGAVLLLDECDIGNDMNEKRNDKTPLTQELLTKDYIFSIGCNADGTGADEIEFNFYKNDRANDVWVGKRSTVEGPFSGLKNTEGEAWSSENFYDESEDIILENLKKKDIEDEYRTLFQSIKDIFGDNPENIIGGLTGAISGAAAGSFISLVSGGAFGGLALALAPFTGGVLGLVTATAILGDLATIFTYGFSEITRPQVYRITKEVFDQLNPNLKSAIITQFLSWILPNVERIKKQKEDLGKLKNIVGGEIS